MQFLNIVLSIINNLAKNIRDISVKTKQPKYQKFLEAISSQIIMAANINY